MQFLLRAIYRGSVYGGRTSKLPMSMVRGVKKAKNGDILIASYLGVFRFDGKTFTNLTKKIVPTRKASFWDVLEDRKGNLWFASKDSGVYYLPSDQTGQQSFQHFTTKNGLASDMVLDMFEDSKGNIWLGTSRYDGKTFQHFSTKDGFPTNNFRLILEDKTGKLWFGGQGVDLFVYDGKTFTVLKDKNGKAFNGVWSVIEDSKGHIWFGADGLWRYDPSAYLKTDGTAFKKVSDKGPYDIIQDKNGNIWTTGEVLSGQSGLSRYAAETLYNEKPTLTEIFSLKKGVLSRIVEANDGSIWFGAMGPEAGIFRFDGKTVRNFRDKD